MALHRDGRVIILSRAQSEVIYDEEPPMYTYVMGLELTNLNENEVCLRWLQQCCEMGDDCEFVHDFDGELMRFSPTTSTTNSTSTFFSSEKQEDTKKSIMEEDSSPSWALPSGLGGDGGSLGSTFRTTISNGTC